MEINCLFLLCVHRDNDNDNENYFVSALTKQQI